MKEEEEGGKKGGKPEVHSTSAREAFEAWQVRRCC